MGQKPDREELARLVRKYGRDAIAGAASKVVRRGPGRPKLRRRTPARPAALSPADAKQLARLVNKHGRRAVAEGAKAIDVPDRGRPSILNYFERMHLASCIDEWAEEDRKAKIRSPKKHAMRYALENFEAYLKDREPTEAGLKRLLRQGRRERREQLEMRRRKTRR